MELYLFENEKFQKLYNCTSYNIEDVPLENRQHIFMGITFLVMFVTYEMLYFPCVLAIRKHLDQSCYKLMFFIGIADMLCLIVNSLLHGIFSIKGSVFCSYPNLIYLAGVAGFFLWIIESSVDLLLAINRCIEMYSPALGEQLFKGNRTWYWLIIPSVYALYPAIYKMPVLYSGIYFAWFFNPHVGYIDDFGAIYENTVQTYHNWIIFLGLTSAYLTFTIMFFMKTSYGDTQSSLAQKASFLQVLAISVVNAACGMIYIYMQFFRINTFVIYLASYLWVTAHGLPSVIYLLMNKTIRSDCRRMICAWVGKTLPEARSRGISRNTAKVAHSHVNNFAVTNERNMVNRDMVY